MNNIMQALAIDREMLAAAITLGARRKFNRQLDPSILGDMDTTVRHLVCLAMDHEYKGKVGRLMGEIHLTDGRDIMVIFDVSMRLWSQWTEQAEQAAREAEYQRVMERARLAGMVVVGTAEERRAM